MTFSEPSVLPSLDFSDFTNGSDIVRRKLAQALVASFKDHGFVRLTNHGLPEDIVAKYMDASRDFFDLPPDVKRRISNEKGPKPQRGFSYVGAEQTSKLRGSNLIGHDSFKDLNDYREHFDAGPPFDEEYPNKWPSETELPGFQSLMQNCYLVFQSICLQIMAAIESGLDLSPDTLVRRCVPAASELRLNHYPPISIAELAIGRTKRTWPHTDFGIITLLFQDSVGGLQMEDRRNGSFVDVPPPASDGASTEMIVNISDTFQRWTNDYIRAGVHQVSIPPFMRNATSGVCPERHSAIFFFKAHRETSVGPLPEFVSHERPARYDEITALEYQRRKTKILY